MYIKEARRADRSIPPILCPLDKKMQNINDYDMIDVNDYMPDMTGIQRHRFILQLQQVRPFRFHILIHLGLGGSRAGIYPHIIWRVPPESKKDERDEGMVKSQKNIDFLNKNTVVYHTRAERSAYLAVVVNRNFVSSTTAAQAIFEFNTGDRLKTQ